VTSSPPTSGAAERFAFVAVLAAVLAIGAAVYEWTAAWRAEAALAAASQSYGAAQREWRTVTRRDQTAEKTLTELQRAAEAARTPAAAVAASPAAAGTKAAVAAEQKAEWQRLLAVHPEVRDMVIAVGRHQFDATFGSYLKSQGFSSGQIEQLETTAMEGWFAGFAIGPHGDIRSGGSVLPPPDQLRAVLGDQGAQQIQDFNRSMPAMNVVNDIATKAGLAAEPISPEQATQLARIMTANSASYAAGKTVNVNAVDWTAALAQVGTVLSPVQAQAAGRVIATLQYQSALQQARQAAGGNP
jgi:hypothetical protein